MHREKGQFVPVFGIAMLAANAKNRRVSSPVYWEKFINTSLCVHFFRFWGSPFLPSRRSVGTLSLHFTRSHKSYDHTSSFLEPISVRSRSANKAGSKGFLNVSLILERSKLAGSDTPSGNRTMRMTSLNPLFLFRFWQI